MWNKYPLFNFILLIFAGKMWDYFVLKGGSILVNIDLPNVGETVYSYMD